MIIPIRCFSCNKTIADKYEWYIEQCKRQEEADKSKQQVVPHFYGAPTKEVLDKMGLTRYCCRRMIVGHQDMMAVI